MPEPRDTRHCDCLIVGGGPAGAVLAGLLARHGHAVVLVDDGRCRRAMPQETLLPGARPLLQRLGVVAPALAAGTPALPHAAIWGSEVEVPQQRGDPGLLLDRATFDAGLRRWAVAQGATLWAPARVLGPLPVGGDGDVVVQFEKGRQLACTTRTLVLATGRTPSFGGNARDETRGPETAALCLLGHSAAAERAVIEAVPAGWTWWSPLPGGRAALAVLVDAGELRQRGSRRLLEAALASSRGPARSLRNARLQHAVRATARLVASHDGLLRCGDAAATIDPLSSQGLEKALASADNTAAAVRTLLLRPELRPPVLAERQRFERGLWLLHARTALEHHRNETRFAAAPFWRLRHEATAWAVAASAATTPGDALPHRLVAHPGLRSRPGLRRVGDAFEPVPGAVLPDDDAALTHIGFVPVPPLLAAFATPQSIVAGVAAAARDPGVYVLPPQAVHAAVVELFRRGYLLPSRAER